MDTGSSTSIMLPEYKYPPADSTMPRMPPITPPPIDRHRSPVYISYSRSSPQHRRRVREFADWLHESGIAVVADFYYPYEIACGPQQFVERGITSSPHVLAVCCESYTTVWNSDCAEDSTEWTVLQPPTQLTSWEINLIRVCMSSLVAGVPEVIPIVLFTQDDKQLPDSHSLSAVPIALLGRRVYGIGAVETNRDQLDLLQRLHKCL